MSRRAVWLVSTAVATVGGFAVAIALAPGGARTSLPAGATESATLAAVLFVGSSVHVASSGWFYSRGAVRSQARQQPRRYVYAPVALIGGTAVVAAFTTPGALIWLLPAFFAWQFFHFQKQNLGLVALTAASGDGASLSPLERVAITAAGIAGIGGLLSHPSLLSLDLDLQLDAVHSLCGLALVVAIVVGAVAAWRSRVRRADHLAMLAGALLFFVPVFVFPNAVAAAAGMTIAHGLQYLIVMVLVAAAEPDAEARVMSLAIVVNVALIGGVVLAAGSHLHDGEPAVRALYGAYLGVVMAHFVLDAGLWRLRDEFPRRFLGARVPYLLAPATGPGTWSASAAARSDAGGRRVDEEEHDDGQAQGGDHRGDD